MPHKHKRNKSKTDPSFYDLPPNPPAQPLAVQKHVTATNRRPQSLKRKRAQVPDEDTPRAFTRLLSTYRPPRSGLDDGPRPSHKARKPPKPDDRIDEDADASGTVPTPLAVPSLQPRESLSSFAARVDAALPFSALLSRKGGGAHGAGRERQTKTERKMQKMHKEWREEERRRKERDGEGSADGTSYEGGVGESSARVKTKGKARGGGKGKRKGGGGVLDDDDDDPWAHIAAKRMEDTKATAMTGSGAGLVGLHDVVLAPPRFVKVPKAKDDRGVRTRAGGLKRQEELSQARQSVVEGYRQMMREKRREEG